MNTHTDLSYVLSSINFNEYIIYIYFIDTYSSITTFKKINEKIINFDLDQREIYSKRYYYNLIKKTINSNSTIFTESYDEIFRNDKIVIYSYKIKKYDDKCFPNLHEYHIKEDINDNIYINNKKDGITLINRTINNDLNNEISLICLTSNNNKINKIVNDLTC
jgi:hypothetical protein